jgi:hypothetical protein
MAPLDRKKPYHPLSTIKKRAKDKQFRLTKKAPQTLLDLGWDTDDVQDCLCKLNSRLWELDTAKNHYHKTERHTDYPPTEFTYMDYYRAHNLHCDTGVYTHFHIRQNQTLLIIDSFKAL